MLKKSKLIVKDWSKQSKNNIDVKIKEVENMINKAHSDQFYAGNMAALSSNLEELYDQKVVMLKQRARVAWSLKGDRNTRFYHQYIQRRRCINLFRKVYWHNTWISSPSLLRNAFFDHFSDIFDKERSYIAFRLGSLHLNRLSTEDAVWLKET